MMALLLVSGCFRIAALDENSVTRDFRADRGEIIALSFLHGQYASGNPPYNYPVGCFPNLLTVSLFGASPIPVDFQALGAPDFWDTREVIDDEFLPELTAALNKEISGPTPIQPANIVGKNLEELLNWARSRNARYLYVVRVNLYERINAGNRVLWGHIPVASRRLIDVYTGEAPLRRVRVGREYFSGFLLTHGVRNQYTGMGGMDSNREAAEYAEAVGARGKPQMFEKFAKYLFQKDIEILYDTPPTP